jgi:transcriptional regulator with XRE-family HTH domain
MTGPELHRHRKRLGYTDMAKFGAAVGLNARHARRQVSRWENSETPVPLYVEYLIDAFYTGWRPEVSA